MKPKDLKPPFSWKNREVLLQHPLLYVPGCIDDYSSFEFPHWDELFGSKKPVHIEYCSGNGDWIAQKALQNPDINWVAVEKRFDRCRKIWSKLANFQLKNLFIVCGEAVTVTKHYFANESIDAIYVNFPDPWPKTKHAKNRLIAKPFLTQVKRILQDRGDLTLVTDDEVYRDQMILEVLKAQKLKPLYPEPFHQQTPLDYGNSFFDNLWREKGKSIATMVFKNEHE
ncbi:MAG: tRNA (guanosine(46)-N7)-methyltransferase TrmB [Parachlamydiales bacterium]|nr:tRNA (guanosine(46)-N7)-methyltransferase TrmB [Parachlamydiales bacterium]